MGERGDLGREQRRDSAILLATSPEHSTTLRLIKDIYEVIWIVLLHHPNHHKELDGPCPSVPYFRGREHAQLLNSASPLMEVGTERG